MLRRAAIGLLCLIGLPVMAAETGEQVTSFTLDNGLEVVVIEDHRAPVVVHMIWYRAGSADEPRGSSGVAHFLEHLLFKGTDTLEPGEFSATVAANGGSDNAFTSYDYTAYHQRVAADRLGLMMQMEADRMVNLKLGEDDIATEREVIIEERNQRIENNPSALYREQKQAAQYLHHPYGTPVIGWRHEMEQLDRAAARSFYDTYYAPNNAVVVVAGDVTPDEVRDLAQTHYGPLVANPTLGPRDRVDEPQQLAARHLTFRDPRIAQPYLMRSYVVPERNPGAQSDAAALTLLAEILGGGQTSVLTRKLQMEEQKLVYSSAYYNGTSLDNTEFGLVAVPAPGTTLQETEVALDRVLAEFIATGVDPDQLERIKFQLRAQRIYARDDVARLARLYGMALSTGLTIEDVQAWPDVLQAVTADDIVAAARDLLDDRASVTGYLTGADGDTTAKEQGL